MSRLWNLSEDLRTIHEAKGRKELHLYDFDGTLFRSPAPPTWWTTNTGGWYSGQFSLDPPCIPEKPGSKWWIESTVRDARKSIADPDVWAIMCTGRNDSKFRWRVPQLLRQKSLDFDQVFLKPNAAKGKASGDDSGTAAYKSKLIERLVKKFGIEKVVVWEDSNMPHFAATAKKLGVDFEAHDIDEGHPPAECSREAVIEMDPKLAKRLEKGKKK